MTHADRKTILLRAAYDLLTKADRAFFTLPANSILTRYDDADCDGVCLREDIANELGIDASTDPIPTEDEE